MEGLDTEDVETKTPWTTAHQLLHARLQDALPLLVGVGGILAIITTYAQANCWNPLAKGPGVVIEKDECTVTVPDGQAVLAEQGHSSGRHYWELDVLSMAAVAYAGVAEAGADTSDHLFRTGYAVTGGTRGGVQRPIAKDMRLYDQPQIPVFKPGDRVGFLLDLGAGARAQRTLEYFLNGKSQGVVFSSARLPSSGPLFPAVSGYDGDARFRARFDLPCPR